MHNFAKKMKIQNYLCVDVKFESHAEVINEGESRKGILTYVDMDHFHFEETMPKQVVKHPELQWKMVDRTKHGKASVNSRHVKVEFYIHHDEYRSAAELADMLAQEIEVMGENLCNMNLQEEVEKCHC